MTNQGLIKLESGGKEVRFEYQESNDWYYMKSNTGYRVITKVVEVADLAKMVKGYERRGFVQVEA